MHGRDAARAEALAEELQAQGNAARGYGCNLAHPGAAARLVRDVIRDFGAIDILINNAAVLPKRKDAPWQVPAGELQEVLATNVIAAFEAATKAMRWMIDSGRPGRIINISSAVVDLSGPPTRGLLTYSISKCALEAASHFLADGARTAGIAVITLRAPTTATDMIRSHIDWERRPLQMRPAATAERYLHAALAPAEKVHAL